jgi:hypothetical protein
MAWEACVRCGELSGAKVISSSVSEMRMSPAVANSSCAGVWADQVGAWLPSFLMRGIAKMRAEWAIVCTAHNLLKLAQESVCGEVDHLASKHRGSLRLPFALILTYWALARPHYQLKVDGLLDSPQEIRCLALRRQSWFDAHRTKPSEGCYYFHIAWIQNDSVRPQGLSAHFCGGLGVRHVVILGRREGGPCPT